MQHQKFEVWNCIQSDKNDKKLTNVNFVIYPPELHPMMNFYFIITGLGIAPGDAQGFLLALLRNYAWWYSGA